jgi:hypothetical protein
MNQEGYTLAETLAALLIIGLAVGGLTEAMTVIGKMQHDANRAVETSRSLSRAGRGFEELLVGRGPFASDRGGFNGGARGFTFPCGAAQCGAKLLQDRRGLRLELAEASGVSRTLTLPDVETAHFLYGDEDGEAEAWPRATASPLGRRTLRSIALVAAGPDGVSTLAETRVWSEQEAECQFDLISQSCREAAP